MKRVSLVSLLLALSLMIAPATFAQAQRIEFPAGATSTQVTGQVSGAASQSYVLYAFAGQTLDITLNAASLTVVSPSGEPLVRGTVTAEPVQAFTHVLTESGDYQVSVEVPADSGPVSYTMTISITGESERTTTGERIRFLPGTTGTQVTGQVSPAASDNYVFYAYAGQTLQVNVDTAYLTLISPSGDPLARAQNGVQNASRELTESGDYSLSIEVPPDASTVNYTLNLIITGTPSEVTTSQRISFDPGATAAQVSGQLSASGVANYVLEAFAGQTMTLTVDTAYITLVSPSGEPLARAQNGVQNVNVALPESGDYIIELSLPAGSPTVAYTLSVSITGEPSRVSDTERIRFQAGATSAQVSGQIAGGVRHNYLVNAAAGQTMTLTLDNGTLTVVSPSGQPMIRGTVVDEPIHNYSVTLPESGDYRISVDVLPDSPSVPYTLTVSIVG
ncbi:MAG: hypothetical protein IT320_07635 [Anaerolineae bacterium]|nr:hypothetical protein [Anaerolineae bacterium]